MKRWYDGSASIPIFGGRGANWMTVAMQNAKTPKVTEAGCSNEPAVCLGTANVQDCCAIDIVQGGRPRTVYIS